MRILIATVQVPFVRGGAEIHAEGLRIALRAAGHEAEIVAVPFKWYPPARILDAMLACRLLDLSEAEGVAVDRVIGLKFPAYLVPHPNKVLWVLHQHRSAYDLWANRWGDLSNFPDGAQVRDAIRRADRQLIPEAKAVFTNSVNVSRRLKEYCDLESTPLYHPPPDADVFYSAAAEDYFFLPSRLTPIKRQLLVVQALRHTRRPVRVCFAASFSDSGYARQVAAAVEKLGLERRVDFVGATSEEEKRRLFAHACGVVYPPLDEDYGYVTLEAMLASKPLITCTDSGGPLEFVRHGRTGLVAEATAEALAAAMDELWDNRAAARAMGKAGRELYESLDISWPAVVERLLA